MKKIEFIAPVASMRGNLSGGQTLQYAENNNPAFIAPEGRQYAKNYQPRFIGAKRSKDGYTYFATKTKSATLINAESLERMALLGGAAAWYNKAIMNMELYQAMQLFWRAVKDAYPSYTFKQLMMEMFRQCLKSHEENVAFTVNGSTTYAANPWYVGATGIASPISEEILVKFWLQLGTDGSSNAPIYFTVAGQRGIAISGDTFDNIIDENRFNVLKLSIEQEHDYVVMRDEGTVGNIIGYVKFANAFVGINDTVVDGGKYVISNVAPEP